MYTPDWVTEDGVYYWSNQVIDEIIGPQDPEIICGDSVPPFPPVILLSYTLKSFLLKKSSFSFYIQAQIVDYDTERAKLQVKR